MLSYYLRLRERMRSAIDCSAGPEHDTHPQQDRSDLTWEVNPPEHPETTGQKAAAQEDTTPAEVVDLNDALEAMAEEMKFDWPEFLPVDRIRAGLIQSALGVLIFLALIAAFGFWH